MTAKKKPKRFKTAKAAINKADDLAGKIVRSRGACENCGRTVNLQWCHIIGRECLRIRHDEDNAFCLCAKCHFYFTGRPYAFGRFVDKQGIDHDDLERRATPGLAQKIDWEAVVERLEARRERTGTRMKRAWSMWGYPVSACQDCGDPWAGNGPCPVCRSEIRATEREATLPGLAPVVTQES